MLRSLGRFCGRNAIACLALFIAMSGTAMAAKQMITGANIQDGTITGADVSDASTLKSVDIDESDLSKVPSATAADNATDAQALAGHAVGDFELTCPTGFLHIGPLCWEDIDGSGFTFTGAASRCRAENARLPSWGDMAAVMQSGTALGNGGVTGDWLDAPVSTTNALVISSGTDPTAVTSIPITNTEFARCVIEPTPKIGFG